MAARREARAGAVPQSGHQLALYLRPSAAPEFRWRPRELKPRPLAVRVATADWSATNQWARGNGPGCQRAPQPILPCVQPCSPRCLPGSSAPHSAAQTAGPTARPGARAPPPQPPPPPPPCCSRAHGAWADRQALRCRMFQGLVNSGDLLSRPYKTFPWRPQRDSFGAGDRHCGVIAG